MNTYQEETTPEKEREDITAVPRKVAACQTLVRWKLLFAFLCTVLFMLVTWISFSNLFDIPRDVRQDRQVYAFAKRQYLENPHYWYVQWLQLELAIKQARGENREQDIPSLLQQATPQTIIALLVNKTDTKIEQLKTLAIVPKLCGSSFVLSISKPEPNIWPFKVMLSAEIKVTMRQEITALTVTRLRRGSQELSPNLSWAYFGRELEHLKNFTVVSTQSVGDSLGAKAQAHS